MESLWDRSSDDLMDRLLDDWMERSSEVWMESTALEYSLMADACCTNRFNRAHTHTPGETDWTTALTLALTLTRTELAGNSKTETE